MVLVEILYFHLDLLGQYNLIRFSLMHSLPLEPLAIVMCLETPLWTPGSRVSSLFSGESGRLRGLGDIVILPGWNMGPEAGGKNLLEMPSPEIRGFSPLAFCRQWRHLVGFDAGH